MLALVNAVLTDKNLLLRYGTALMAAPSSTKNKGGERDPAMLQGNKGNHWNLEMKCHISVDRTPGRLPSMKSSIPKCGCENQ